MSVPERKIDSRSGMIAQYRIKKLFGQIQLLPAS
jgi:hypothetical protein